jgi:phosphoribosylformylglycinamidine synthase II
MDLKRVALEHGLSGEEYDHAIAVLGREPTWTEMGVLSVMWSEHCSYKSSRIHLRKFPTTGPQVVLGPGENAGAVDIGDGLAAVFKMESHNHPSYIEPYQGAATGVGGILRDVFTMGARPLASMNSLRFGALDFPKTPHLFHGVVAGIAGYGNCVGVPTVGGEIYFDASYNGNILVNVFTVGIAKQDAIFLGAATGVGNPVFYVGAGTGRDGIHGATMASGQFGEGSEEKRPTVQVGDPFREKLLIEACLELMKTGAIIGIQDMGAAGLTSSSVEMADRGGTGLRLDVDKVPKREEGMTAYEVLLSESQERMLIVIAEGQEAEVARVFDKWELEWGQVGEVTDTGNYEVWQAGECVCNVPISLLTSEAPIYDRPQRKPARLENVAQATWPVITDVGAALVELMGSPNIGSRRVVFEQFDHQVGISTVVLPGKGDAAVLRVPQSNRAIAISVDCNSRFVFLDPREGAKHAVAETTRNVACSGAKPLAITDCLNFGDPTNPEIMWEFVEAVEGLAEACLALDAPVVSGNVSLYNASFDKDIYPTPTVAALGVFDGALEGGDSPNFMSAGFARIRDEVWLLGTTDISDIGGTEVQWLLGEGINGLPPRIDLGVERSLQDAVREVISKRLIRSAHDCSEGGLGVAVSECLLNGAPGLGLELLISPDAIDRVMFCESASRIVVSLSPADVSAFSEVLAKHGIAVTRLGVLDRSGTLRGPGFDVDVEVLRHAWEHALDSLG